ncbi:MAG: ubiquinone/menaquinone biosynthesis methyltransferase [Pirellulaceae bacterium]|nr:ubiquinone/menaquinone biosynthesis methyltransferase [Pirellulaceae bacterium]
MQRFDLKANEWLDQPDRKRQYNVALFDEVAPKYDFVTQALSLGRDSTWKRKLIAALPPADRPQCLDLACGTGDLCFGLADKYPNGSVVGVDICESMLDVARSRFQRDNLQFQIGDMSAMTIPSQSIDIVTGSYALRNAPTIESVLDEITRVLKPGATAAFLDFSKPPNQFVQTTQHSVLLAWGGFWGLALHANPEVYAYIARSLRQFPDRQQLHKLLTERGFERIESERFYFGWIELLTFHQPATK